MSILNQIKKIFSPSEKDNQDKRRSFGDDKEKIIEALSNHPLLEELREWGTYRSKVLDIKDPTKRKMAEYYLSMFFSKLRDTVSDAIEHYDLYLDDTTLLNNLIIDTINDVRITAMSNGVPPIFLDKFTNYLYTQEKILASTYRDLDKFEYYDGTVERAAFRLDIGLMLIRCITSEVESVINNMNGELRAALEGSVFETNN